MDTYEVITLLLLFGTFLLALLTYIDRINKRNKEFASELLARERCCNATNFCSASCASLAERFYVIGNSYHIKMPISSANEIGSVRKDK